MMYGEGGGEGVGGGGVGCGGVVGGGVGQENNKQNN